MTTVRFLIVWVAILFYFAAEARTVALGQSQVTVIEGGTLIDGTGRPPLADAVVVVEGSRIKAVGPKARTEVPAGAKRIDAQGKTILPGFIDAHGHYWEYLPELLITHGTTTLIDTGNYMDYVLAVREASATGKLWGPRVFTTGSGITGSDGGLMRDRFVVKNPTEAKAAAEEHVRRKVDFIKVYEGITADQLRAVTEVAHAVEIPVVGHLRIVDAREAALAGIDGLIHAGGISAALVPESEARVIKATAGGNPWGTPGGGVFHYQMDANKFDDLIRLLIDRRVMIQPDLVHSAKGILRDWDRFDLENRRLLDDPNLAYLPQDARQRWFSTSFLKGATPRELARRRAGYEKMLEFLKRFVAAGGLLLAGSDFVGSSPPGTTLHQELEVFVEDVGLTPMQAIQTATKNPADFYLRGKGLGTLEPGQLADLIVVRGDPLEDIRNTRNIELVMIDGQVMNMGYHAWYTNPYQRPFRDNPGDRAAPSIRSVHPYVVVQGDTRVTLTIRGTGFARESIVWFDRTGLKTTYMSTTELQAEVTEISLQAVGTFPVRVSASPSGGETSAPAFLMVKYRD
ncbi:MAG: amidohydrolase family protein [Acidobacteria bacterium]|nr:amidohydrolase family protein [Acidobacteriota bacterium]